MFVIISFLSKPHENEICVRDIEFLVRYGIFNPFSLIERKKIPEDKEEIYTERYFFVL